MSFTVKCQDVHITVTADALLAVKSAYFDALLRSGFRENAERIIVLQDVFASDFAFIMKPAEWHTTFKAVVNVEQWGRLLVLADRLQIPLLFNDLAINLAAMPECWTLSDQVMNLVMKHENPSRPDMKVLLDRVFDGELDIRLVKGRYIDTLHRNAIPIVVLDFVNDPRCTPYVFSLFVTNMLYSELSLCKYVWRGLLDARSSLKMLLHRQILRSTHLSVGLRVVDDDKESPVELELEFIYATDAYMLNDNRYHVIEGYPTYYKELVTRVEYHYAKDDQVFRTCTVDQVDWNETFDTQIKIRAFIYSHENRSSKHNGCHERHRACNGRRRVFGASERVSHATKRSCWSASPWSRMLRSHVLGCVTTGRHALRNRSRHHMLHSYMLHRRVLHRGVVRQRRKRSLPALRHAVLVVLATFGSALVLGVFNVMPCNGRGGSRYKNKKGQQQQHRHGDADNRTLPACVLQLI